MHVNREIIDQVVLAALVLATLVAVERRSLRLGGARRARCCGVAILGNSRLAALPLVLAAFIAWRLPRAPVLAAPVIVLAGALVVVAPWVVRNQVQVGCFAITTDGRALWKANNVNTYRDARARRVDRRRAAAGELPAVGAERGRPLRWRPTS